MSQQTRFEEELSEFKAFFEQDVCQRASEPLRDGTEIAVYLGGDGPVTLGKWNGRMNVAPRIPERPDMTFRIPSAALKQLSTFHTKEIGELGVEILKLMAHGDPSFKITAKVHIGIFDLLRHGYLSVLPLGGGTVMKFLASKGFTSIGKIKDAISSLRTQA